MVLYVILFFVATCIGMAISVYAFGTGGKRKKIFQDIYFSVEDTNGIGVLYTKTGEYSAILKMENPVQKYSANIDSYYDFPSYWMICCHSLDKRYYSFLRHKGLIHYPLQLNPSCLFVFPRSQDVLLPLSPKQLLPCQHSSWHPMWVACRSCPCMRSAICQPMP